VGGGSNANETASKMGLPVDILTEAEGFGCADDGIFPDNMQTVKVFSDMLTQWRVGPGGIVGLDYGVIPIIFRIRKIRREDREEIFDGLTVMERAAMDSIRQMTSK
jgi:hypothetical protein